MCYYWGRVVDVTPHKYRCETCAKYLRMNNSEGERCPLFDSGFISDEMYDNTALVGCASHSDIKGVVEK
ncbi:MAG: hypothetical protein PHC39_04930 [Proteiniphilum sp.]|nr:hypothetical protein [Proteiniphilum sp.]